MWVQLTIVLIQLFGPIIAEWLRKRLQDAAQGMDDGGLPYAMMTTPVGKISALFDQALEDTYAWNLSDRLKLKAFKYVALKHADDVLQTVESMERPLWGLSGEEKDYLVSVLDERYREDS